MDAQFSNREQSVWRIEVRARSAALDARGREVLGDIRRLGFEHVRAVRACRLYFLEGDIDKVTAEHLAAVLLCDPVSEAYTCAPETDQSNASEAGVEVNYKPGVMDPAAMSTLRAVNECLAALSKPDRGRRPLLHSVHTAWRYSMEGACGADELERIARSVLANDCIESFHVFGFGKEQVERQNASDFRLPTSDFHTKRRASPGFGTTPVQPRTVPLRNLSGPEIERLSRDAHLFLSRVEMEAIREHFRAIGRDATDLELETLAQTWSEHCVHKTLKSEVVYRGPDFGRQGMVEVRFDNLLKSTIVRATRELDRDWCLSVFEDNAGVIAFDDEYGIAFKVETHNHPSAIEPYGGAATGLGGCIRDILGCGLGAKPVACTDVFCVAPPDYPAEKLPRGVLHPARTLKGVVAGVRDYGNRMGIPTVNGAVYFDERYLANPLVFCGCVGLIPRDRVRKAPAAGDLIVLVGGRTGRDGIHGATFSSGELTGDHADEFSHAVQIGNAIEEKKVLDALLQARDHTSGCLYSAVTDCGAGGLSSAVGEMAATLGAVVDLEKAPLKYAGLRYDEIWISEAQERMVLAVPPERLDALLGIFAAEDSEPAVIGRFTGDGRLVVRYQGVTVGDLDLHFLHEGLPKTILEATWSPSRTGLAPVTHGLEARATLDELLRRLSAFNVASKEWVIRQYDHEVQGGSVLKPLCGPGHGPGDAAVIRPRLDSHRGIALGCGLCPHVSERDPYWMSVFAIDEALRNVLCVGAGPDRIAILDNFCWGDCRDPAELGALVRACRGAYDTAVAYSLPFISGKDSLNNFFSQDAADAGRVGLPEKVSIPGTLLVSAVGVIEDVRRCVSMDLKRPGCPLALVAAPVDRLGLAAAAKAHRRVAQAVRDDEVLAAHDVSDGGLGAAVAEMCIAARMGVRLRIDDVPGAGIAEKLFEEYPTAYVLECADPSAIDRVGGIKIGIVTETPRFVIEHRGEVILDAELTTLAHAWSEPLVHRMGGGD